MRTGRYKLPVRALRPMTFNAVAIGMASRMVVPGSTIKAEVLIEGLGRIVLGIDDEGVGADAGFVGTGDCIDEQGGAETWPLAAVDTARRPSRMAGMVG